MGHSQELTRLQLSEQEARLDPGFGGYGGVFPPLELEKIAVPTLVLAGRHSLVMGPDAAQSVALRLQHGKVVIFEHSAHALALEEAEHFQHVVADFVLGTTAR